MNKLAEGKNEWLVRNFCDKNKIIYTNSRGERCTQYFESTVEAITFLYSPLGFFAIWDAVETSDIWAKKVMLKAITDMYEKVGGKDRYEAFYNAVYEAMNEKIKM